MERYCNLNLIVIPALRFAAGILIDTSEYEISSSKAYSGNDTRTAAEINKKNWNSNHAIYILAKCNERK